MAAILRTPQEPRPILPASGHAAASAFRSSANIGQEMTYTYKLACRLAISPPSEPMHDFIKYPKALASILGVGLALLGIASIPGDVETWSGWLKFLRGGVPWWVLLTCGLLLLAVTWGPGVWARWARRRNLVAKATEADVLREKLEKAEADARQAEQVTENVRELLMDARKELESANGDGAFWRAEARSARALLSFGVRLIDVSPIGETERVMMRGRIQELMPTFHLAIARADAVWEALGTHAESCGENHPLYWLHRRVDANEHGNVVRIMGTLSEALQNSQEPRAFLACAYTRYREWRTWVLRFAALSDFRPETLAGYREWREADTRFFDVLKDKVAIDELTPVREAISRYSYEDEYGPPEKMRPPLQS